jgi:hypothetical protein
MPEKPLNFAREPIEGLNLEPRFLTVQKKIRMDLVFPAIMLIQILILNGGGSTDLWEPQNTFSPASQKF